MISTMIGLLAANLGVSAVFVRWGAIVLGVAFLALSVLAWGGMKHREGYRQGVAYMQEQNRLADEAQRAERNKTDADVDNLDTRNLCRELGGGLHCEGQNQ